MKTKLTLFVTVLAVALFGVGCASTQTNDVRTYHLKKLKADGTGILHNQNERLPITGRVVGYINGVLAQEFIVKNGLKHGPYRRWHNIHGVIQAAHIYHDSVYENGKLIKHKEFWYEPLASRGASTANGFQMVVAGWNQDGTPKKIEK